MYSIFFTRPNNLPTKWTASAEARCVCDNWCSCLSPRWPHTQTVMQKDSIEALPQIEILWYRKLVSSLARVFRDLPSKIIEELTSWSVKNAQGLYRNWLKDVTSTEVDVFLLFASGCYLCCCRCLKSSSVNVWLSQWTLCDIIMFYTIGSKDLKS